MPGVRARAALLDAFAVIALVVVGASALDGTFDGPAYLGIAALGATLGVGCAVVAGRLGVAWPLFAVPVVATYFLIGPAVALRGSPAGVLPSPASAAEMARLLTNGWKDLLTTLPPVAAGGRLVGLVLVLGLIGGAVGMAIARSSSGSFRPVIGPFGVLVAAVLLGVAAPGGHLPRAVLFGLGAVAYAAVRRRRLVVTMPGGVARRVATGAALVAVAAGATAAASPSVRPDDGARVVLRSSVLPPVDLADRPSPLSLFRTFRPAHDRLADDTLFTVTGLPAGTPVRIATLDSYSGSVWAAGDGRLASASDPRAAAGAGFVRVGSRIPTATTGDAVTATVRVGAAYADTSELRIWLPTVGHSTAIRFTGERAYERAEDLRFNQATGSALLVNGVRGGDTYRVSALVPRQEAPTSVGAVGKPAANTDDAAITAKLVAASTGDSADPVSRVAAVAERLRTTGAYTDGAGEEQRFLPGHSVGRLQSFVNDSQPAGNDEQYAAALALAAAQVGLPSRVVLAAVPGADGTVRGADVRAWVEVQVAPTRWWSIAPEEFVPDRDKRPTPRRDEQQDLAQSAVVPPPNAHNPPSNVDQFILDSSSSARSRNAVPPQGLVVPLWATLALVAAGVPMLVLAGWAGLVMGAKSFRRRRRRTRGSVGERIAAGWVDVVDGARDQGVRVGLGQTRSEQASAIDHPAVRDLAVLADGLAFGAGADDDAAVDYWERVDRTRVEVGAGLTWREWARAGLSPLSLLPTPQVHHDRDAPSARHERRIRKQVAASEAEPVTG